MSTRILRLHKRSSPRTREEEMYNAGYLKGKEDQTEIDKKEIAFLKTVVEELRDMLRIHREKSIDTTQNIGHAILYSDSTDAASTPIATIPLTQHTETRDATSAFEYFANSIADGESMEVSMTWDSATGVMMKVDDSNAYIDDLKTYIDNLKNSSVIKKDAVDDKIERRPSLLQRVRAMYRRSSIT